MEVEKDVEKEKDEATQPVVEKDVVVARSQVQEDADVNVEAAVEANEEMNDVVFVNQIAKSALGRGSAVESQPVEDIAVVVSSDSSEVKHVPEVTSTKSGTSREKHDPPVATAVNKNSIVKIGGISVRSSLLAPPPVTKAPKAMPQATPSEMSVPAKKRPRPADTERGPERPERLKLWVYCNHDEESCYELLLGRSMSLEDNVHMSCAFYGCAGREQKMPIMENVNNCDASFNLTFDSDERVYTELMMGAMEKVMYLMNVRRESAGTGGGLDGFDAELSRVILVSSHPDVRERGGVEVVRANQVFTYIAGLRAQLAAKLQPAA